MARRYYTALSYFTLQGDVTGNMAWYGRCQENVVGDSTSVPLLSEKKSEECRSGTWDGKIYSRGIYADWHGRLKCSQHISRYMQDLRHDKSLVLWPCLPRPKNVFWSPNWNTSKRMKPKLTPKFCSETPIISTDC